MRRTAGGAVMAAGAGVIIAASAGPARADVPGAGIVKDVVGGAAGFTFGGIASGMASWVMGAVGDLVAGTVDYLGTAARPRLDADWFSGAGSPFALVRTIAGTLLIGFVLLAVVHGLVAGDLAGSIGRIGRDLVLAVMGMAAVIVVTVKLLDLTDALSAAVLQGSDAHAIRFLSGFGAATTGATGGFAWVLVGLVVAVGALLVWVELMVRSALVYLLVALSPLAFAAMTWPAARGVLRRTVELLLAVVVSKFVICVTLALGAAALGGAGSADPAAGGTIPAASLGTLLAGAAVLGLAAFSPFVVLRLIPFAEAAAAAHGVSRSPLRGAQAGAMAVSSGQSLARLAGTRTVSGMGTASRAATTATPGQSGGRFAGAASAAGGAPTSSPRAGAAAAQGRSGAGAAARAWPDGSVPQRGSQPARGLVAPRPEDHRRDDGNRGRRP